MDSEIQWHELYTRITNTPNVHQIAERVGLADLTHEFHVGQLLTGNPPESAQRRFLRALGYEFQEDDVVTIV